MLLIPPTTPLWIMLVFELGGGWAVVLFYLWMQLQQDPWTLFFSPPVLMLSWQNLRVWKRGELCWDESFGFAFGFSPASPGFHLRFAWFLICTNYLCLWLKPTPVHLYPNWSWGSTHFITVFFLSVIQLFKALTALY